MRGSCLVRSPKQRKKRHGLIRKKPVEIQIIQTSCYFESQNLVKYACNLSQPTLPPPPSPMRLYHNQIKALPWFSFLSQFKAWWVPGVPILQISSVPSLCILLPLKFYLISWVFICLWFTLKLAANLSLRLVNNNLFQAGLKLPEIHLPLLHLHPLVLGWKVYTTTSSL